MRVLVLVPELDGDLVVVEGKKLFAQPIAALFSPFLREEIDDGIGAREEGAAIAPDGVGSVCFCDGYGISMGMLSEGGLRWLGEQR